MRKLATIAIFTDNGIADYIPVTFGVRYQAQGCYSTLVTFPSMKVTFKSG
jgi:hypothetical protein